LSLQDLDEGSVIVHYACVHGTPARLQRCPLTRIFTHPVLISEQSSRARIGEPVRTTTTDLIAD
jgi:hypothetical protein